jgi:hypothetical protein
MKKLIIICALFLVRTWGTHAQLTNSGNIRTFTGANVTIYGDVTNNASIVDSGTLVTLAGSSLQAFGGSSITTLNNLRLNNSSAPGVTLAQAMNVRGTLTFTDGYLNTTAVNLLTMTSTSAVSGASNNSFVFGPVTKIGNTAFVFPTGKNVVYAPISIAAPAVVTDQFTAEYFQVSPTPTYPAWSYEPALNHVSECEYWMLDRITGSSNVAVTLSWDTRSCGVTNLSDLRVARWDGTQWTDKGNGGTTGTTAAGTVVSSAAVTGFGPFTLASSTLTNPLPVELIAFSAYCEQEEVILRWSTASEFNNDYFTVENSLDALDWQTAATLDGNGTTSNLTNYLWVDPSNPGRDMYYRLSQTDYNGVTTIHDPVYLKNCSELEGKLSIYPNPAKSIVNILTEEKISQIRVLDPAGKIIAIPIDYEYKQLNFSELSNGVYFIEVRTQKEIFNQKVVLSRD